MRACCAKEKQLDEEMRLENLRIMQKENDLAAKEKYLVQEENR